MIYVASPYSHYLPTVREQRYLAVRNYVIRKIAEGVPIFSPIIYAHRMSAELGLPTAAVDWWPFNRQMILFSRSMQVLTIDGWKESLGVAQEMEEAERMGISIELVEYPEYADL